MFDDSLDPFATASFFDPFITIAFVLVLLGFVAFVIAIPIRLVKDRKEIGQAWEAGYQHALSVHGIAYTKFDMDLSLGDRKASSRSESWEAGYRAALERHHLSLSERDSQELWHNPHRQADAARIIARTNHGGNTYHHMP